MPPARPGLCFVALLPYPLCPQVTPQAFAALQPDLRLLAAIESRGIIVTCKGPRESAGIEGEGAFGVDVSTAAWETVGRSAQLSDDTARALLAGVLDDCMRRHAPRGYLLYFISLCTRQGVQYEDALVGEDQPRIRHVPLMLRYKPFAEFS